MDDQAIERDPAKERWLEERRQRRREEREDRRERNQQIASELFHKLEEGQDRNRQLAELIVAVISALVEANMWTSASEAFGPRLVADLNEVMRAAGWVWEAPREVA